MLVFANAVVSSRVSIDPARRDRTATAVVDAFDRVLPALTDALTLYQVLRYPPYQQARILREDPRLFLWQAYISSTTLVSNHTPGV